MRLLLKFLPVLFILGLSYPAYADGEQQPGTIDIQGMGEVSATPDLAYVTSGVITQNKTAREALSANTVAMSELIGLLKSAGIEERDIQTSNFSVQPQYVYSDRKNSSGYSQPPKIDGYQVSNMVTVRVRNLDNLGDVLDQMVTVGANTINSVSFAVDDTSALLTDARKRAVANAIEKANLYADAAGVGLGRILNISENGGFAPKPVMMRSMAVEMDMASSPVPVQSGELTYNITVSVRWELDQ